MTAGRLALLLILLVVVGCSSGGPAPSRQGGRTAAVPTPEDAAVRITREEACDRVGSGLERVREPLDLIADGGTPVSYSGDLRRAADVFTQIGQAGPDTVGYFSAGLGEDLNRLVAAMDDELTATAKAVGEVVTQRVVNLENACKE